MPQMNMNNEAIEDLDYNEQLAAATNRLFEILRTEESVLEFCDEVLSLLQRFPKAAGRVSFQGGFIRTRYTWLVGIMRPSLSFVPC